MPETKTHTKQFEERNFRVTVKLNQAFATVQIKVPKLHATESFSRRYYAIRRQKNAGCFLEPEDPLECSHLRATFSNHDPNLSSLRPQIHCL